MKKFIIALPVFVALFLTFAAKANATGLQVNWSNSQNQSVNYADYKGNTAKVTINLSSDTAKTVTLRKETFACDFGSAEVCGQNPTVTYETVTVAPGNTVSRTVTRSTKDPKCGNVQVDFYVTDNSTGVKTGPYWDLAYTGKDCVNVFPACPPTPGANLPDGKKWDVGYTEGLHWIVGNPVLQKGADYVYFIGGGANPKHKVLQCFYPKKVRQSKIQTNWLAKGGLNLPGWILVPDGTAFGLLPTAYLALNSNF